MKLDPKTQKEFGKIMKEVNQIFDFLYHPLTVEEYKNASQTRVKRVRVAS